MSKLLIAFALVVAACGGKKQPPADEPPPAPTAPAEPATLSAEECTAKGGEVRGDIGDGKIACQEGEQNLGRVPLGIEGSICCAKAPAAP